MRQLPRLKFKSTVIKLNLGGVEINNYRFFKLLKTAF